MRITNHLAILRNLRNIAEAGVSNAHVDKIKRALTSKEWALGGSKILPFRYVAAARAVPAWEPAIDAAMQMAMSGLDQRLAGTTAVLVDVSYSMSGKLSEKSDLSRMDAACALAALVAGVCDTVRVFSFSNHVVEVPPRQGMALIDAIRNSQPHSGTYLGSSVQVFNRTIDCDRIIVITDEQSADAVPAPKGKGYMINVATCQNGVGYGSWVKINGFSEAVVNYIQALESEN